MCVECVLLVLFWFGCCHCRLFHCRISPPHAVCTFCYLCYNHIHTVNITQTKEVKHEDHTTMIGVVCLLSLSLSVSSVGPSVCVLFGYCFSRFNRLGSVPVDTELQLTRVL